MLFGYFSFSDYFVASNLSLFNNSEKGERKSNAKVSFKLTRLNWLREKVAGHAASPLQTQLHPVLQPLSFLLSFFSSLFYYKQEKLSWLPAIETSQFGDVTHAVFGGLHNELWLYASNSMGL